MAFMWPRAIPLSFLIPTSKGSIPVFLATYSLWSKLQSLPPCHSHHTPVLSQQWTSSKKICIIIIILPWCGNSSLISYLPIVQLWSSIKIVSLPTLISTVPMLPFVVLGNWRHVCSTLVMCRLVSTGVEICVVSPTWLPSWPMSCHTD